MRTPLFVCATVASFMLLACDGAIVSNQCGIKGKAKALSKTCPTDGGYCYYDDSDSAFFLPHDPNWFRIEAPVKEWMEEQLATGDNEVRLIIIVDSYVHENAMNLLGIQGKTEYEYYVDGRRVSFEEYTDSTKKMEEYAKERAERGKRDLPIPEAMMYETDYSWVGVPMTAKEIADLTENYKELIIEFYTEAGNATDTDDAGDYEYDGPVC
ncbi:MAG: hypothetical protein FWC26_13305 [Fibromonadales bacterium]|nr:hypothetical protein [Fibromonadales bacterium]